MNERLQEFGRFGRFRPLGLVMLNFGLACSARLALLG